MGRPPRSDRKAKAVNPLPITSASRRLGF